MTDKPDIQPVRVEPTEGPYVFDQGSIRLERNREHVVGMPHSLPGMIAACEARAHGTMRRLYEIECANGRLLAASWDLLEALKELLPEGWGGRPVIRAHGDCLMSDYLKYRGKCREMSEALIASDPSLSLVRGYYMCPLWGKQEHWWCKKPDGTVVDPTKNQFPSRGIGDYVEFDGTVECAQCSKRMQEDEAEIEGRYAFCSYECHGRFVGAFT